MSSQPSRGLRDHPALRFRAGIVLGIGLGAFVDGIIFHQVLRWHHFISDTAGNDTSTVDGLNSNTLADGLFHVASWLILVAGLIMMWRSARAGEVPSGRVLAGSLLTGGALFNLFDAIASHWILGLHHIHEGSYETLSDVIYFVVSLLIGLAGLALARSGQSRERALSAASAGSAS
ncbi:MAG TPA: DUF2243 domain-containing protein [Thermoleophilaceae bacterium]|nr:DUF2243 domain-containing protein [Thermoleophilaceae bacterium]